MLKINCVVYMEYSLRLPTPLCTRMLQYVPWMFCCQFVEFGGQYFVACAHKFSKTITLFMWYVFGYIRSDLIATLRGPWFVNCIFHNILKYYSTCLNKTLLSCSLIKEYKDVSNFAWTSLTHKCIFNAY